MTQKMIVLGKVKDLAMTRVDFEKGRTLRIYFNTEDGSTDVAKPNSADASIGFKRLWHDDLNDLMPRLEFHMARMGGLFGHLAQVGYEEWPNEAKQWWLGLAEQVKINSLTWAGEEKLKIKLSGSVTLPTGYVNCQPPLIDIKRSKYAFMSDFEELLDSLKFEVTAYLVDKKCAGGTQMEMNFEEPDPEDQEQEEHEPEVPVIRLGLPASSVPTSPAIFRNGLAAALKSQPTPPKLTKGEMSIVSEHLRDLCACNGCFAPEATFVADAFFNAAARAISDASKELKTSDVHFRDLVTINVSTNVEDRVLWKDLKKQIDAVNCGYFQEGDLGIYATAFMKLMAVLDIHPMQRWHNVTRYFEELVRIAEADSKLNYQQLILATDAAYQQLMHN